MRRARVTLGLRRVGLTSLLCSLVASLSTIGCDRRQPEPSATQPAAPVEPARQPQPDPPDPPDRPAADEPVGLARVAGIHYLEYVTGGAEVDAALPMIVAIHGLGDSPEGFADVLRGFDRPARVIVPRGLEPFHGGWSWFSTPASARDFGGLSDGIAHAADALAPAIAQLTRERPTVGKPLVTGFSQGGMLSFALAAQHSSLIAAALPIGGWLPELLYPDPALGTDAVPPILAFHGEADARVPFAPTQALVDDLSEARYDVELRSYPGVGHSISRAMRRDLFAALAERLPAAP